LTEPEVCRLFGGIDLAVSAAGYNTYEELLAAKVPSVFFSQRKGLDRQDLRIHAGHASGYLEALPELDPALLTDRVARLKSAPGRAAIDAALHERRPARGALRAAVELLLLHSGLPGSPIDRHELFAVASARASWISGQVGREFAPSYRRLHEWRAATLGPIELDAARAAARSAWRDGDEQHAREGLAWGQELDDWNHELEWPARDWRRLLAGLGAGATSHGASESRARLLQDSLETTRARFGAEIADALTHAVVVTTPRRRLVSALRWLADRAEAGDEASAIEETINDELTFERALDDDSEHSEHIEPVESQRAHERSAPARGSKHGDKA
jgi:hypothetical protein